MIKGWGEDEFMPEDYIDCPEMAGKTIHCSVSIETQVTDPVSRSN